MDLFQHPNKSNCLETSLFFISDEASVFSRDIVFFISEEASVFSRDIAFFLGRGFGLLSRHRFFTSEEASVFSQDIALTPDNIRKSRPQKANKFLTHAGDVGATRADSSSRRLPLEFLPVGRSRRENREEISTKNVSAKISGAPEKFGRPEILGEPFCAFRAWTCRREKLRGADVGYLHPRASHPDAVNLTNICRVFGALIFQIFSPKIALTPEKFRKSRPQKAKQILTHAGGVGATRADSSSRRLPGRVTTVRVTGACRRRACRRRAWKKKKIERYFFGPQLTA